MADYMDGWIQHVELTLGLAKKSRTTEADRPIVDLVYFQFYDLESRVTREVRGGVNYR